MENLNINGLNYPLENLSTEARAHLASYQFAEEELIRLNKIVACLQTARNAYFQALNESLPILGGSDTIKL